MREGEGMREGREDEKEGRGEDEREKGRGEGETSSETLSLMIDGAHLRVKISCSHSFNL